MTVEVKSKTDKMIERLVARVIEVIEAGTAGKWEVPWQTVLAGARFPVNAATGASYHGMNTLIGMVEAIDHGYESNVWATYKQWLSLDAQVRKGERGVGMMRWNESFICDECPSFSSAPCKVEAHVNQRVLRGYPFTVFNAAQVDGYELEVIERESDLMPDDEVTVMVHASGAVINEQISNEAYYSESEDEITLPLLAQFDSIQQYYGTLLHELTHWTGHKDRLDRHVSNPFGSKDYAREELVAEFGAVFLASHYGLEIEPHPNHVAYLASWLEAVKEEPRVMYEAAKQAQAAFSLLVDKEETDGGSV